MLSDMNNQKAFLQNTLQICIKECFGYIVSGISL